MKSAPPPGGNGTSILTVRAGQEADWALHSRGMEASDPSALAPAAAITRRRKGILVMADSSKAGSMLQGWQR